LTKRARWCLVGLLSVLSVCSLWPGYDVGTASWAMPQRVVVIDAGHGGKDPGAIGRDGAVEKTINLSIARLVSLLAAGDPRLRIVLTRSDDRFVELADRIAEAERWGADAFVSIHANAHSMPSVSGVETFIAERHGTLGPSASLARELQSAVSTSLGARDRGVKQASLFIGKATMPAALLEVGFLTNRNEARALQQLATQRRIAEAVLDAVCRFFRVD